MTFSGGKERRGNAEPLKRTQKKRAEKTAIWPTEWFGGVKLTEGKEEGASREKERN